MTHVPNFAHERLAMFLFPSLFEFLSCWTNLKFFSLPPLDIVQKYFEFNPEDNEPIWTVNKIFKNFIFLLFLKFVFFYRIQEYLSPPRSTRNLEKEKQRVW